MNALQPNPMDFIRAQPPFDHLIEIELRKIEQKLRTEHFAPGTHILDQGGTPSRYLYLVYTGAVRLVRDGQVVQILEEGECFGYPSLINGTPPTFDVVVEEDTVTYKITKEIFLGLIENGTFAGFFLKSVSERLRYATNGDPSIRGELTTPIETLVVRPLVTVSPAATVAEAAQVMRRAWVDAALVMDQPIGIITDHDFQVKVLAEELGPETLARQVMSRPIKTLPVDTPVHGALLFMLEENIHHLPVTKEGQVVGVVTATDLLRHQAKSPLYLMRQLEQLESPDTLARYVIEVAATVETLYAGGLDVAKIGRMIASLNDALVRRLLRLAEEELGPPPTPYAWIVFGSDGRMEQALLTDQDNALLYLEDSPEAQQYFKKLGTHVVNNLVKAGFPPCPGGYMATNWCKSRDEWVDLFDNWIKKPEPQALVDTAIFFDFRFVYGDLSLEPLEKIIGNAGNEKVFLAQLARAAIEFRPPLGFFRRIRAEDGQVNLKFGGIAPIVSMARVYALQAHTRVRTTVERLEAAGETGTLSKQGSETLIDAYRFLLQLRLREQLATIALGNTPNNNIHLDALSPLEKRHLKDTFLAIREMQEATASNFHTDMLG